MMGKAYKVLPKILGLNTPGQTWNALAVIAIAAVAIVADRLYQTALPR